MPATTVRPPRSSQPSTSMTTQRTTDPATPATPRVAPYLTHLVTHHGQLTLIPPQNAGRIRSPKTKKKRQGGPAARERHDEPRFTTAVPPSASRRINPSVPPHARPQRQNLPQPARPTADALLDVMDVPVPDYPPPTFQEAILSSPSVYTLPSPLYANSAYAHSSYSATPQASPPRSPAAESCSLMHDISPSCYSPIPVSVPGHGSPRSLSPLHPRVHSPMSPPSGDGDASVDSDEDSVELLALEPEQHWEADRSTGLSLHQRVHREFVRQQAAESSSTVNLLRDPSPRRHRDAPGHSHCASFPSTPVTRPRRCSHCGSLRPGDGQSEEDNESGEESDHMGESTTRKRTREKTHRSLDLRSTDSSPPPSPASIIDAPGFSPWASTATLLSNAFSLQKSNATASGTVGVKRKESVGLRKLFMKGKEKEREREREREKVRDAYCESHPPFSGDDLQSWEEITPSEAEVDGQQASLRKDQTSSTRERVVQRSPAPSLVPAPRPMRRNQHVSPYILPPSSSSDVAFPPEKVPPPSSSALATSASAYSPSRLTRETHVSSPTPLRSAPLLPGPRQPRDRSPLIGRFRRAELDAPYPAARMSIEPSVSITTGSGQSSSGSSINAVQTDLRGIDDRSKWASNAGEVSNIVASPGEDTIARAWSATMTVRPTSPLALPPLRTTHAVVPSNVDAMTSSVTPFSTPQTVHETDSVLPATPTTPTTPTGHHYHGRPLPCPPTASSPNSPTVSLRPMTPSRSPAAAAENNPERLPERASSLTSIASHSGPRPEWSNYTDLDVFVARLDVGNQPDDGRNYEDLLRVSEFIGPAEAPSAQAPLPGTHDQQPLIGCIEVERRRITKDGRVKLKLTLLGIVVDKCGICLSQFKEEELAALAPVCQHSFHEKCLRRWLVMKRTCPLCRVALSLDSSVQA